AEEGAAQPSFFFSKAALMLIVVSSLTMGTYLPTPKSERLTLPSALKPSVRTLLKALGPAPLKVTLNTTGLVTPWMVRSPAILAVPSPVRVTEVETNFMERN